MSEPGVREKVNNKLTKSFASDKEYKYVRQNSSDYHTSIPHSYWWGC